MYLRVVGSSVCIWPTALWSRCSKYIYGTCVCFRRDIHKHIIIRHRDRSACVRVVCISWVVQFRLRQVVLLCVCHKLEITPVLRQRSLRACRKIGCFVRVHNLGGIVDVRAIPPVFQLKAVGIVIGVEKRNVVGCSLASCPVYN